MHPLLPLTEEELHYPESDGKPLGESTLQVHWIMMLYTNLVDLFSDRPSVFIAAELFWYPVEGHPEIVTAPDVMVAFDRPPGHRRSYRQWREDDVPPAVVFEVQSHTNTQAELQEKLEFYQEHGVKEYYLYDPTPHDLFGYRRCGKKLVPIREMDDFRSPLLGVRFDLSELELRIFRPDGEPFVTISEIRQRALRAQEEYLRQVAEERLLREAERIRGNTAEREREAAEREREAAEREREAAEREREAAERQREKLAARLRELGVDPDSVLGK